LVCVSYGTLNNQPEMVARQAKEGIDAVIVDSVLAIRKELTAAQQKGMQNGQKQQQQMNGEQGQGQGQEQGPIIEVPQIRTTAQTNGGSNGHAH